MLKLKVVPMLRFDLSIKKYFSFVGFFKIITKYHIQIADRPKFARVFVSAKNLSMVLTLHYATRDIE
jgi:hypothetical protein